MKTEFSASKLAWAATAVLHTGALAVALMSLFFESRWSTVALLAGVFVPIVTAACREYAGRRYDRGERLRRLLVRSEAFGVPVESQSRLAVAIGRTAIPSWDPDPIGSYYSSPKEPGPARLAHIVAQSALFTAKHAGTAKSLCWAAVVLGFASGIALVLALIVSGTAPEAGAKVAQAASLLIAFGFTGEFFQLKAAYGDLAASAERSMNDCCALAREVAPDPEVVAVSVAAYDCALAKAPPIPGFVYRLQRDNLDRTWQEIEARPAAPGGSHGEPA